MKTKNLIIPCAIVALLSFGCEEKIITDKGETALELKASSDSVACDQRASSSEALQLTWTSGTNAGTGAAISYLFEMDLKGNDFQGGMKFDIGKTDSRVISFTHKELTDTLLYFFPDIPLETYSEFEARVTATVASPDVPTQVSPVITLKIAPYKWRILTIYLIGDAAPNGWDNQLATAMTADYDNMSLFTWEGVLKKGELKFITQLGSWLPCYVRDENDPGKMVFRENEEDYPDNKWNIESAGIYRIEMNTEALTIQFSKTGDVEEEKHLYMVGDATPGGWDSNLATELTEDENNAGRYSWQGALNAGELKFITELGSFLPCYVRDENDPGKMVFRENEEDCPDYKWEITSAGNYHIELDINNLTISITLLGETGKYEHIWMIGDATPGGWSWDKVTEMAKNPDNPNEFSYDGYLSAGEIKFPLEINHDWSGQFILAPEANCAPTENGTYVVGNQPDNKWKITEAGNYRIVINAADETISFTRN